MLQRKYIKPTTLLLFFSLLIAGTPITSGREIHFTITQAPVIDGVVNSSEYNSSQSFDNGNYKLYWEVIDGTSISIGIVVVTTGWVAIGIDPTTQMQDADILYGWVEANGTVILYDAFSRNPTGGDHPQDNTIGGTNDILSYNGSQNATSTTLEFTRLLSTSDLAYDNDIPASGNVDIIWAYGADDSFSSYHSARGSAILTTATIQETTTTTTESDPTTTTTQEDGTTTAGSAPGFQGFFLLLSLIGLVVVYRKFR